MLELQHISFSAEGKGILDDVSLEISDRFVAVTGPNGGGKSTLAKVIMGIEKPDSGRILLDGEDITDLSITERANRGISYAFQQPVRFKGLQVKDLLKIAAGRDTSINDACSVLSEVGLCARDYIDRELNATLSGGELKRIEIAMALERGTKMTIFDEPEAGIDLWSFQNLIRVFEKMYEQTRGSILIISHQERILDIADKIIYIKNGIVEQYGDRETVLPLLLSGGAAGSDGCKMLNDKFIGSKTGDN
ncbi:MAG TPA: ATP-binding cassette domain-containing protein [Bacillota bacterium]|nr:ATP-binding cassette domain-containing protein [Bacillota bacterium]